MCGNYELYVSTPTNSDIALGFSLKKWISACEKAPNTILCEEIMNYTSPPYALQILIFIFP